MDFMCIKIEIFNMLCIHKVNLHTHTHTLLIPRVLQPLLCWFQHQGEWPVAYYQKVLFMKDLPDIMQCSQYYMFQQDGALVHQACYTVKHLKFVRWQLETPDFVPPNLWSPSSPDLNPVDFKTWGILQEKCYKTNIKVVSELWQCIAEKWDKLGQSIIDKAFGQWR